MLTGSLDYGGQWVQINEMHFVLFSNLNGLKQAAVDSSCWNSVNTVHERGLHTAGLQTVIF